MTPFRAMRRGYESQFEPVERAVLAKVARDVVGLLREEAGLGPTAPQPATDPASPWASAEDGRARAGSSRPVWTTGDSLRSPDDLSSLTGPTDAELARMTGLTGVARVPSDPAVLRLLPDASKDDPDVAAEFRHLTQADLAQSKVARLEALADLLDPRDAPERALAQAGRHGASQPVRVRREDAAMISGALNDVRLVIAERLRLDSDEDVERLTDQVMWENEAGNEVPVADDERAAARFWAGVFVITGIALESLVDVMLADLRRSAGMDPGPEPE
ncbi:DUF2017 family protein [Antribacter gilvus]|uniref:DUF2017 family protein n=1 Tax=Antribacter gilvus TaxID=2304675 RepID=UPI000F7A8740|nr:DUF2017 family protein [Antribacter gilvus]